MRRLLTRTSSRVAVGGALAVVLAWSILQLTDRGDVRPAASPVVSTEAKTYAQLVAANYRVLTPAQTRRLLAFAAAIHSCLVGKGVDIAPPNPRNTRIELIPGKRIALDRLVSLMTPCAEALGGPPRRASLQVRPQAGRPVVLLYLPKRCLLDRKTVGAAGAPAQG
jgi:hypothetical protein